MKRTNKIIRNNQVITKKIQDEFIVIDANKGNLFKLNDTAQTVWSFTRKPASINEIIEKIIIEFSVDEKKAEKEVIQFIQKHLNTLFFLVTK